MGAGNTYMPDQWSQSDIDRYAEYHKSRGPSTAQMFDFHQQRARVVQESSIVIIVVASAIGYYLHGAWNLVDEAVCGVIVGVPWMIAYNSTNCMQWVTLFMGIIATCTAVTAAALLPAWSILEVLIVSGLALAGVWMNIQGLR